MKIFCSLYTSTPKYSRILFTPGMYKVTAVNDMHRVLVHTGANGHRTAVSFLVFGRTYGNVPGTQQQLKCCNFGSNIIKKELRFQFSQNKFQI